MLELLTKLFVNGCVHCTTLNDEISLQSLIEYKPENTKMGCKAYSKSFCLYVVTCQRYRHWADFGKKNRHLYSVAMKSVISVWC